MYEKFQQATIAITYDSDERSVENIPFPAIFITPEIFLPSVIVQMAWNMNIMGLPARSHYSYLKYLGMLNRYLVSSLMCNYRYAFQNIEKGINTGIDDFITIMKSYASVSWLKQQSAVWNAKFRPEFVQFLGQNGYGFSFNMLSPDKLYQKNVTDDFFEILNIINFNISDISKDLEPISYQNYPLKTHGRSSLKLTLAKNHFIPYKSICQVLFFNIHSPFEFPGEYDDERSNKFYYGQDLDVYITPDVIRSEDDLRSFSPEKRNCFFEGEKKLKMFKVYTRKNCEMECLAQYYLEREAVQCVPYYIIRNSTMPLCKIEKDFNIKFDKFSFSQNITFTNVSSDVYVDRCGCLDTCNDVQYNVEVMERRVTGENKDRDNATMTITFMYKYDKYLPLVRRISFSTEDFLCQAGGLLGLYAGISALSVVELLYFMIIRPFFNFYRWISGKICKR